MAPSIKQKAPKGKAARPVSNITDPRFANIQTDPRFRLPSKKNKRVQLDSRFARVLEDDDFSRKSSVDRYGRKIDKGAGKKELERLYTLEKDEDTSGEDSDEADDDKAVQKELSKANEKYDPARGGGFSSSESESDDDDEDVDVEEAQLPDTPSQEAVPMGEVSSRLAAVNLDWDNIRAVDIMAVAESFAPAEGRIISVIVYPSEFGREQLEREELEGPPKEIFAASKADAADSDSDSDAENEEIKKDLLAEDTGEEFNSSALREYQMRRLKYYYAVITTSSPAVGEALYTAMDGREYLSSANFFDLRFIPDEVSFETDKPHDTCTAVPDGYKPNEFVTDALTHSKVKLTWDADDTSRKEAQKRAFSRAEIDENDLQAYIGSGSSSEESDDDAEEAAAAAAIDPGSLAQMPTKKPPGKKDRASALRAKLGLNESSYKAKKRAADAPVGDMEITFTPGLSASSSSAASKPKSIFANEPPPKDETTIEKYKRKERERKQRRKEERAARTPAAADDNDDAANIDSNSDSDSSDGGVQITFPDQAPKSTSTSTKKQTSNPKDLSSTDQTPTADLGFNDPFFTNPLQTTTKPKPRKPTPKPTPSTSQTTTTPAELSLLLTPDDPSTQPLNHFNMTAIERAEKRAARKSHKTPHNKHNKHKKSHQDENEHEHEHETNSALQPGFKMDVADARFAPLFESHEFAIDPTNPRFRSTAGMKAVLEEGRRRRKEGGRDKRDGEDEGVGMGKRKRDGGKQEGEGNGKADEDIGKLVERVKKRSKGAMA
ncbi:hypothetical protein EJ05DRAFT_468941 [Pseudovirgaria hyperparasitica]|uniref:Uncharacterized protein n=1 Tax=Pseudovirgaria hyperparasitica TaxID=470096 RepID=A0A6A6VXG4_9PEZI|nr:uncharacterized protein EJ05DRAFT_468941 [Pseudovirgaria hyperparasitica]KAF2754496.1 hypothetical protein EJ05DRAFT_468941 [Pseudovirgaria hyperparasitica]